jgi:membrane protease subunit HflC
MQKIPPQGLALIAIFGFALILVAVLAITGRLGVAQIADHQVAVLVNYISGEKEVIARPGFKLYLPFVREIYLFDRSSQEFTMQGDKYMGDNHVPRLTVRANDGSNFWFDELTILFELIPGEAAQLLEDSGPGDGFKKNWIKAYARSVLRDEFGRYSAVEAADPTQYTAAAGKSRDRLNELLASHGLRVTRIITPKPKFDDEYEEAIERRKEANQEVERLRAKEQQLEQEREQRLAAVEKEKEIEMQALTGDLRKALLAAEENAIEMQRTADAYAIGKLKDGEGEREQLLAMARGLEAKYTKEAEGLQKRVEALEQRGRVVVREALIKKLLNVKFTMLPYSRDPEPRRIEHVQSSSTVATRLDEQAYEGGK